MSLTNLTIDDLLGKGAKLTFLVGAGCSIDAPSSLPAGRSMMEAILNFCCEEKEIKNLMEMEEFRFEALVEIFRDNLDVDLKIIEFYSQCTKPNIQHFFLADMITKGHFVLTTNFDLLIEHALLKMGVSMEDIRVIITRKDFEVYSDPFLLFQKGLKTLYKIHGSTKNIISNENTKDSLITTIQAFGSNKDSLNVFQLEPFKQPLFEAVSKGRSIVIMGYSGSDDFDVVPTLKVLKDVKDIIWLNFTFDDEGQEKIYEIGPSSYEVIDKSIKINKILLDIQKMYNAQKIYRVDVNTSRLISELLEQEPPLNMERFELLPSKWMESNIPTPSPIQRLYITHEIYYQVEKFDDSMRIGNEVMKMAHSPRELFFKASILSNFADINHRKGNYNEGRENIKEAMDLCFQLQEADLFNESQMHNLIIKLLGISGSLFYSKDNYLDAIRNYEESAQLSRNTNDKKGLLMAYKKLALIYADNDKDAEALEYYDKALDITEQLGDLYNKASILLNMGNLYRHSNILQNSLDLYEKSLEISEQLGYYEGIVNCLNNIGIIHQMRKNFPKAEEFTLRALEFGKKLGYRSNEGIAYHNLGRIYTSQKKLKKAITNYKLLLKLGTEQENLNLQALAYRGMALVYLEEGNEFDAMEFFEKAINFDDLAKNKQYKVENLENLGQLYRDHRKRIEVYQEIINIADDLGDLYLKLDTIKKIALLYYNNDNLSESSRYWTYALEIADKLGDLKEKAEAYKEIGFNLYKEKKFEESLQNFENQLELSEKLEDMSGKAKALKFIGQNLGGKQLYDEAIDYLKKAYEIGKDTRFFFDGPYILEYILDFYILKKDYPNALKQAQKLLELDQKNKGPTIIGLDYLKIGEIYYEMGDFKKAQAHIEMALSLAREENYEELEGRALFILGKARQKQDQSENVIYFFKQALNIIKLSKKTKLIMEISSELIKVADKNNDMPLKARTQFDLGIYHLKIANHLIASKFFQQSMEIFKLMGDDSGVGSCLEKLGDTCQSHKKYQESNSYYEAALEVFKKINDNEGKAFVLIKMGKNFSKFRSFESALQCFQRSRLLYQQTDDLEGVTNCFFEEGKIVNLQSDYEKSLRLFRTCVNEYRKIGKFRLVLKVYKQILKVDEKLNNTENMALDYLELGDSLLSIKDSLIMDILENYGKARKIADELKDEGIKALSLKKIGLIHLRQKKYLGAHKNLRNALALNISLDLHLESADCLNNIGLVHYFEENYREAISASEEALNILIDNGLIKGRVSCLKNIADSYVKLGNSKKANEVYEKAAELALTHEDESMRLELFKSIAEFKDLQRQFTESLKYYNLALELAINTNQDFKKADILFTIGLINRDNGNPKKAINFIKDSLEVYKILKDDRGKLVCYKNIGYIYGDQGQFEEALEYLTKALKFSGGHRDQKANLLNNIATCHRNLGDNEKAMENYLKALEEGQMWAKFEQQATSYEGMGHIRFTQENYDAAASLYELGAESHESANNLDGKAKNIYYAGRSFFQKKDYVKALRKYDQALKLYIDSGATQGKAMILYCIGDVYAAQEKFSEALRSFKDSLRNYEEINDTYMMSLCLKLIGNMLDTQKNYEEAIEYYGKSLELDELRGDQESKSISLNNIADTFYDLKNYDEALKYYKKAIEIYQQLGDKRSLAVCSKYISLIFKEWNNDQKALAYIQNAVKYAEESGDSDLLEKYNKILDDFNQEMQN